MNTARRPEIFVSATSGDLRSCRQLIKEALLTARIADCDAVIHLAGEVYGAEPHERSEPRRSYTQLEYEIARELKKPVYVFVYGEEFLYDPHEPEDDERRTLQRNTAPV